MTYTTLAYLHLATVLPAWLTATIILLRPKGTPAHRLAGRIYVLLMTLTAAISLLMPAAIGPRWINHFGLIHGLSVITLITLPVAIVAVRRGRIRAHQISMVSLYCGGLLLAGGLTLLPGRLLHTWLVAP